MDQLTDLETIARLSAAAGFGAVLGLERGFREQKAGLRTHVLIALASALFTIVSINGFGRADPSRVAAQIVAGVGFLGAGAILQGKGQTRGLTTAASIWTAAGLGMAAGTGMYVAGGFAVALSVVVLSVLKPVSRSLATWSEHGESNDHDD
ncbi:MAG: MgtC/SapB family protein [Acidimicrobiales bacterium]